MEYPVLSLSAASVGLCERGVTAFYDIVWSFDYYLENITPETEFGFLFFLQDALVNPMVGGTLGPGLGYTQGLDLHQYNRPDRVSTYYTPSGVDNTYNTVADSGLNGGLLGVGFDSTGCYALSVSYGDQFIRDGKSDSERIPNSVAVRGGAPDFSYNKYSVNYTLTNFNIIDSVKKTVRARLGNLGRTIYIDYRYKSDEDFIPLLTQDVDLGVSLYNFIKPGITITKNISSSNINSAPTIVIENFHFEGKTEIPVIDPGTIIPELSVFPLGPLLSALPPDEPGPPGDPGVTPNTEQCFIRKITTVYADGSIAPLTTVELDGTFAGISDVDGIVYCSICNGYRRVLGYKDILRGTTELFVEDSTVSVIVTLSPAGNPDTDPSGPLVLPAQINVCDTTVSIVSAYIAGYDSTGSGAVGDLYNYGYAISASGFNDILYRIEPFKYVNNSRTLTLELKKLNENWILSDIALNSFVGQLIYPIGAFNGSTTINLTYYNE